MIEVRGLSKRYGPTVAVDDLTFDVVAGRVTGFLGPNGAGKSTTMRLIVGLDAPSAGTVTVGGRRYRALRRPLFEVGATLESAGVHPGRSAQGHLLALGVVVMTSEYQSGSIRSTFAAVPQRRMVLAAKAAVFGAVAAATGIISAFGAFVIGQAILSRKGIQAHIGDPGVVRSVLGAGLYLAVLGLLALGLGTLIRRTAGAIAALVGLVLILPVLMQGLPPAWQTAITRYLPSAAGQAIIGRTKFVPPGHLLSPWAGFAVLCAYAAGILIAAAVTLDRRDA